MTCVVCGEPTNSLTEHRLDGGEVLVQWDRPLVATATTYVAHPDCCPGGCDAPEEHTPIAIV